MTYNTDVCSARCLPPGQCPVITVLVIIIHADATFQLLGGFVSVTHSP